MIVPLGEKIGSLPNNPDCFVDSQSRVRPLIAISIVDYSRKWQNQFASVRDRIWPHLSDIAVRIEHIGSTSVAGLAAKPAIDLDIVIRSQELFPVTRSRLVRLGYKYRSKLSAEDREAFKLTETPAQNLYVCLMDGISLRNHITFRDHLRSHASDAAAYAMLKKELARRFPRDKRGYIEGKTVFVLSILAQYGFSKESLDSIRRADERLLDGLDAEQNE